MISRKELDHAITTNMIFSMSTKPSSCFIINENIQSLHGGVESRILKYYSLQGSKTIGLNVEILSYTNEKFYIPLDSKGKSLGTRDYF